MCYASLAKVIEVRDDVALVDFGGIVREAAVGVDDVRPGDYVLVHAGLIISKVREEEMERMVDFYRQIVEEYARLVGRIPEELVDEFKRAVEELMR